jgi:hypothetical protein
MAMIHSPSITTLGLVLCLDASNTKSYSGSGTAWRDLSGNNNHGTLVNGPTFSSANNGAIVFDGTNDFVSLNNSTALDTQTPTVEVWIKTNNINQNGFFFEKGSVNTQYSLFQEGTNIVWRQVIGGTTSQNTTTATYISTSRWAQIVGTYTSGDRRTYINGNLVTSDTQAGTISTNSSGMYIGAYGTGTGYYYNGSIAIVRVYNRVLSTEQVLQNFNVTRRRFGI